MLLYLLTYITLSAVPIAAYSARNVKCPIPPICMWGCDYRRKSMDCSDSMLGPYSPELPDRHEVNATWSADFSFNSISIIQNMSYFTSHYEAIQFHSLNYSSNVIRTVEPTAFLGLENVLHTLILDNNRIENLPALTIRNLTSLRVLSLRNNSLLALDFVCLNSLPRLHQLNVADNLLTEISPSCFYGTRLGKTEVSNLIISGNRLRYLDACTFQERQFHLFDYTSNNFICMCKMSWLDSYGSGGDNNQVECHPLQSNDSVTLQDFHTMSCEPLDVEKIQCVDMVVNATYKRASMNESEVHVNWHSKEFPNLAHFHATIYSFQEGVSSEVGRYKLRGGNKAAGYSIMIPEGYGDDLIICIEAARKLRHHSMLAPVGNEANPMSSSYIQSLQNDSRVHVHCQQVSVLRPQLFYDASRSGSSKNGFRTSLIIVELILTLYYHMA